MRDYKKVFGRKFKDLERGVNRSFREFRKLRMQPQSRPVRDALTRLIHGPKTVVLKLVAAAALTAAVAAGIAVVYPVVTRGNANLAASYVGDVKVREDFEKRENPEARGGNEIRNFNTNDQELRLFFYIIKQGESIYAISRKLGVSMDTLISLNAMENAHTLGEGRRIIVPNLQGILYGVKKNDTLESIAKKYKVTLNDILDANDLTDEESEDIAIHEGQMLFLPGARLTDSERAKALGYLFVKPLRGRFTSGFGIRTDPFNGMPGYHAGIDISAPYGAPVYSSKEGRVVFAGWQGGYGKCVIVRHQFGYETVYGHLSVISVKKDAWVRPGQFIGRVGSTGRSTGPHLHFEVRKYGRPVNPVRQTGLGKARGRWY